MQLELFKKSYIALQEAVRINFNSPTYEAYSILENVSNGIYICTECASFFQLTDDINFKLCNKLSSSMECINDCFKLVLKENQIELLYDFDLILTSSKNYLYLKHRDIHRLLGDLNYKFLMYYYNCIDKKTNDSISDLLSVKDKTNKEKVAYYVKKYNLLFMSTI